MVQIGADGLPKGKRSAEVLDVAFGMFAKKAIESVSMTDIADEARIGVATIYRYFGTKKQLVVLAGARQWRAYVSALTKRLDETGYASLSGIEQIEALTFEVVESYEDIRQMLHFSANCDQYFRHEEVTKELVAPYRQAIDPLFNRLIAAFDKAVEEGSISDRYVDDKQKAGGLISLLGSAQKYALGGLYCGDDIEVHKMWLRTQAKSFLYVLRHADMFEG